MEKWKPHYPLAEIQQVVRTRGISAFTATALSGIKRMRITRDEAINIVLTLTLHEFYKSMTTFDDSRVWQDVYHAETTSGLVAYIKVTLRENGAIVIQFKEK